LGIQESHADEMTTQHERVGISGTSEIAIEIDAHAAQDA
jgi:hypothetical protein